MLNRIIALLTAAMFLACAGSDQEQIEYDAPDGGEDIGQTAQAYSIPTGTTKKLLGSNTFSAGDECKKDQNTTATCRFLLPPAQPACGPSPLPPCSNFHVYKLGIFNPTALSAADKTTVETVLTQFAARMTSELTVAGASYGLMTYGPYAQANLAVEIVDLPDPVGTTSSYSPFVTFAWNGCGSSNLPETPAMPGTWRGCSSATIKIDWVSAKAHIQGGSSYAAMVLVHGLLVEMGLGRQTAVSDRATNPSLSALAEERWRNGDVITSGEACHLTFMTNRTRLPYEVTSGEPIDLDFVGVFGLPAGCGN